MKTMGREAVMINKETIDLRYVEQITDSEQVTALGILYEIRPEAYYGRQKRSQADRG